jgi:PAS domain S-box-containing protein
VVAQRLAFDLAPTALCLTHDRVVQDCNAAFGELFGFAPSALVGQSLSLLYPSHHEFEQIGQTGYILMQATGRYQDERIMRRADGSLFWCAVRGRALQADEPFACAVWSWDDRSAQHAVPHRLTVREREIAQHLVAGKSSKHIARLLGLSHRTVEGYRARLCGKLGAQSSAELIAKLLGGAP